MFTHDFFNYNNKNLRYIKSHAIYCNQLFINYGYAHVISAISLEKVIVCQLLVNSFHTRLDPQKAYIFQAVFA